MRTHTTMQFICPVSGKKINETTARFTAFLSFTLLIVLIVTTIDLFLWFLALDFFMRALAMGKYSPLAAFSQQLYSFTVKNFAMLNAGPKIFAARIGFFCGPQQSCFGTPLWEASASFFYLCWLCFASWKRYMRFVWHVLFTLFSTTSFTAAILTMMYAYRDFTNIPHKENHLYRVINNIKRNLFFVNFDIA